MNSWSDSLLTSLNTFFQWAAPACTAGAVFCAVCLIFVKTEIGRRQNLELSRLKLETENTKKETAIAQERSAQANEKAEEARAKQAELEKQNLGLRTDLAKVQVEAANAQRTLLEVQERIKPRQITEEQKARIVNLLRAFPKGTVSVECADGDPESYSFAKQITDMLRSVPFDVTGPKSILGQGGRPMPLCISVRDNKHAPKWAGPLQRALGEIGFTTDGRESSAVPEDAAVIFVGAKPPQ